MYHIEISAFTNYDGLTFGYVTFNAIGGKNSDNSIKEINVYENL